jgi:hypothetical protein
MPFALSNIKTLLSELDVIAFLTDKAHAPNRLHTAMISTAVLVKDLLTNVNHKAIVLVNLAQVHSDTAQINRGLLLMLVACLPITDLPRAFCTD